MKNEARVAINIDHSGPRCKERTVAVVSSEGGNSERFRIKACYLEVRILI